MAKVAAGRKMLEVVFYVLRDGRARSLTTVPAAAEQAARQLGLRAGRGTA